MLLRNAFLYYLGSHGDKDHSCHDALLGGDRRLHGLRGLGPPVSPDCPCEWSHEGRSVAFDQGHGHGDEVGGVGEGLYPVTKASVDLLGPEVGKAMLNSCSVY